MTGTLVMFVILLILLTKLPESGGNSPINSNVTSSCNDVSPLNSGDAKAFWVSYNNVRG